MSTRVAIYARYSSDRQNERSIEDQVGVCVRHAASKGWSVVEVFSDAALSGATMANRPGLNAALAAAGAGQFDILLAEDEDRIARNLEHQAHVFNRLRALGVAIATLHSDAIGILEVGLKGVMNEIYLDALSAKTKRGLQANAAKGLATGSKVYGYRSAPGGAIAIVEEEAEVVRRIFAEYRDGRTPRQIADGLNRDGVPALRGKGWSASTINGAAARGSGILQRELYTGVMVTNRIEVIRNRQTGRRTVRARPAEQWARVEVPHLAIVRPDVWAATRARKAREAGLRPETLVRRPALLSGLLRCACGASYTVMSTDKLGCAAAREKGPSVCTNRRTVRRSQVEAHVLGGLLASLLSPEAVKIYVDEFRAAMAAGRAEALSRRQPLERRLAELDRKAERLISELLEVSRESPAAARIRERLDTTEAEAVQLRAELASIDDTERPIELHPGAADAYRQQVGQLQAYLATAARSDAAPDQALIEAARGLIDRIDVVPQGPERGAPIELVVHGKLTAFLRAPEEAAAGSMGAMVPGGGFSRSHTPHLVTVRLHIGRAA